MRDEWCVCAWVQCFYATSYTAAIMKLWQRRIWVESSRHHYEVIQWTSYYKMPVPRLFTQPNAALLSLLFCTQRCKNIPPLLKRKMDEALPRQVEVWECNPIAIAKVTQNFWVLPASPGQAVRGVLLSVDIFVPHKRPDRRKRERGDERHLRIVLNRGGSFN